MIAFHLWMFNSSGCRSMSSDGLLDSSLSSCSRAKASYKLPNVKQTALLWESTSSRSKEVIIKPSRVVFWRSFKPLLVFQRHQLLHSNIVAHLQPLYLLHYSCKTSRKGRPDNFVLSTHREGLLDPRRKNQGDAHAGSTHTQRSMDLGGLLASWHSMRSTPIVQPSRSLWRVHLVLCG